MKIDWNTAPEWAIAHALFAFMNRISEVWVGVDKWQRLDQPKSFPYGGGLGDSRHNPTRGQFEYETPRPVTWIGEGLPPVGTVCEMHRETYFEIDWQPVTLLCVGQAKAFFRDKEGCEWSRPLRELSFRPIRTPEQIAAEERLHNIRNAGTAIAKALATLHESEELTAVTIIEAMIDAGYRKQVTECQFPQMCSTRCECGVKS